MPASDRPETESLEGPAAGEAGGRPDPEAELASLAEAVERLLDAYAELRTRAGRAEAAERGLAEALAGADLEDLGSEEVARRMRELGDENRRLRELITQGRERAERIRSRLILMEDEA